MADVSSTAEPASQNPFIARSAPVFESIKVNRVWLEERNGRRYWLKRRRRRVAPVLWIANGFFKGARAPMHTITDVSEWQRLEVGTFLELHGAEGFHAFAEGTRTIGAEELPGINLTLPLDSGTLTPEMTHSAGAELRRAHGIRSAWYDDVWSHGDPHAGNFIFDPSCGRARMIDFEVEHIGGLSAGERHVDDVFVFLQDVAGRIRSEAWLPCAKAFLTGYGDISVTSVAVAKLDPPTGRIAELWWRIRTGFLPMELLHERFDQLRREVR
jgi:hypothetical protein